jgi:hypothetical protein
LFNADGSQIAQCKLAEHALTCKKGDAPQFEASKITWLKDAVGIYARKRVGV